MKFAAILLSILLFLSGCSNIDKSDVPRSDPPLSGGAVQKYVPDHALSMEETIENYFALQYDIYTGMQYYDISYLIDTTQQQLNNELIWLETLTMRRRLIAQNQLCYVETQKFPYTIRFDKNAKDDRMEFWRSHNNGTDGSVAVNFTITGEKGKVYPPLFAVNNQHTMFLKQENGVWKIILHYYPGASRFRNKILTVPNETEMLSGLSNEFKRVSGSEVVNTDQAPSGAAVYNGTRAVEYASKYTETANPIFYNAGDWQGNCSNFASQCLWAGFGGNGQADVSERNFMTSQWHGGEGGGTSAWESVVNFWNYAIKSSGADSEGIHGSIEANILQLKAGGIIQTRQQSENNAEEDFGHSLLLVDPSTLMLAQNSPDNFIYYSDLVGSEKRFFNPTYLIE